MGWIPAVLHGFLAKYPWIFLGALRAPIFGSGQVGSGRVGLGQDFPKFGTHTFLAAAPPALNKGGGGLQKA